MPGGVVAVEGPSAAGKTRAVAGAARLLGAAPLAEAYDRLDPRPALTWRRPAELLRLERRLLREEGRRFLEARDLARAGSLVLADTGFLGPLVYSRGLVDRGLAPPAVLVTLLADARTLAAGGRWGFPDALLYLRTPAAERARRARLDPLGHPAALQARHQEVGELERVVYRDLVAPRLGSRFRLVGGTGPPAEVARRLARASVRARAALRGPPPPVGPLLRALAVPP